MAKRSNGEGTIYKRKDGIWCASRYVPCGNGKFKRKYVYGKTQKSVKEKLKELENYEEPKAQTTTLVGRMLEWMEQYKKNVLKITTYENYLGYIRTHVQGSDIADIPLEKLSTSALQKFYNMKLKGTAQRKQLSRRTVEYLHTIIGSALEQAYKNEMIAKNVNEFTVLPKKEEKEIEPLTIEDLEKVLRVAKETDLYSLILLEVFNGMRKGDDDDKIRLNQRKPSKYKGLRRFGPEKNLQRINKFMKERPIFYKNLIQMKENIRFYLRCFYCITKVMILQFNSENRTELARNG